MINKTFLPYVKAHSASKYFALPKREREKYGFYLKPYALPWSLDDEEDDGWNYFEKRIKKEYPIQFFFRETLAIFWGRRVRSIKDLYYPIRNWFDNPNKRIRDCVPRHKWIDRSNLVWEINAAIIVDFYEEMGKSCVDWEHNEEIRGFKKWITEAVNIIKKEIPEIEHDIDCTYKTSYNKQSQKVCFEKIDSLERKIDNLKMQTLNELIKYREYLWT